MCYRQLKKIVAPRVTSFEWNLLVSILLFLLAIFILYPLKEGKNPLSPSIDKNNLEIFFNVAMAISGTLLLHGFLQLYKWSENIYSSDLKAHEKFWNSLENLYEQLEDSVGETTLKKIIIKNQLFFYEYLDVLSEKKCVPNAKQIKDSIERINSLVLKKDKKNLDDIENEIKNLKDKLCIIGKICYSWETMKIRGNYHKIYWCDED